MHPHTYTNTLPKTNLVTINGEDIISRIMHRLLAPVGKK